MALLLATFVVIPVADLSLCATESADAHSVMAGSYDKNDKKESEQNNGSSSDNGHDACSHGHCHHIFAHISPSATPKVQFLNLMHPWPASDALASRIPDGLMRPPKA